MYSPFFSSHPFEFYLRTVSNDSFSSGVSDSIFSNNSLIAPTIVFAVVLNSENSCDFKSSNEKLFSFAYKLGVVKLPVLVVISNLYVISSFSAFSVIVGE